MRLDELANSSFLQEGKLEGDLRRRGKEEGSNKISSFLKLGKTLATRRARGNLFWVKLKRSLQEIAIGIDRPSPKGILDTRLPFSLPNPLHAIVFSNMAIQYQSQIYVPDVQNLLQCI